MEKSTTAVAFACQQCMNPIKISWMHGLTEEAVAVYKDPGAVEGDHTSATSQNPDVLQIDIQKPSANTQPAGSDDSPDSRRQLASQLFGQLSSQAPVDHPLCEACTHAMLDAMDNELRQCQTQKKELKAFLSRFQADHDHDVPVATLEAQLGKLDEQIGNLTAALDTLEEEEGTVQDRIAQREVEIAELEKEEAEIWRGFNELQLEQLKTREDQELLEQQYRVAQDHLEFLKKTNVYNDTFHIWFDGHYGTINGFRLGRLPAKPVGWEEINAGLGQALLLLDVMAMRLHFKLDHKLKPRGSLSKIEVNGRDEPLYGPPGSKMFGEQRIDKALVAFLSCLGQFKDHVETLDPHFKLPYEIQGDIIRDSHHSLSIKYTGNTEEAWTKALKFALANMKWCLAWMCKQMTA
eukprot:m.51999 g.51999  ORF g.51999 m.51999 type:complete len:407 (+) comp13473_c0_seq1:114-1334(+)